jgi:hypothetical protein
MKRVAAILSVGRFPHGGYMPSAVWQVPRSQVFGTFVRPGDVVDVLQKPLVHSLEVHDKRLVDIAGPRLRAAHILGR